MSEYANRTLFPPEVVILARYYNRLSEGRVLDVGCGAGRVYGYLLSLCKEVEGIDISEAMLGYCRAAYPNASVRLGDLGALAQSVEGSFDVVLAAFNVLGGFEDSDRRRVLGEIRELLAPDGLFIFSSHNLERTGTNGLRPQPSFISRLTNTPPARVTKAVGRRPRQWLSRRRLRPFEYHRGDHAILTDVEGDNAVLHYYIGHGAQEAQLHETGYELLECIDIDGQTVPRGLPGKGPWLYYVARRTSVEAA